MYDITARRSGFSPGIHIHPVKRIDLPLHDAIHWDNGALISSRKCACRRECAPFAAGTAPMP